jgi:hypothetical protein
VAAGGLVLAGAVAAVLAVGGAGAAAVRASTGRGGRASSVRPAAGATVTVTGSGSVTVIPDTMTLQIGATTNAASAATALERNDAEVARLETVLRASGVPSSGLQTSNLELSANTNAHGKVTGYQASDQLTVVSHQLAKAGAVIDAAAHAVGNDVQINGIAFSRANLAPFERAARVAAMRQAAADASALASAAGARLGGIVKVTDELPPAPPVGVRMAAAAASPTSVPIQRGTTTVSAQVQVVYALVG